MSRDQDKICWKSKVMVIKDKQKKTDPGSTCKNFERDARVIFLVLKFIEMSFFGFL